MATVTILNTTAGLSGKTVVLAESAATITGLHTFDRDPSAPFGVSAASAVVANLDADKLDGLEAAAFLLLAGGTMVGDLKFTDGLYDIGKTGATRPRDGFFSRNVAIGGTLGVTGVTTLSDDVKIAATKKLYLDGGGDTYIVESSANVYDLYTGSVLAARWNAQQQHVSAVQFGCKLYNNGTQALTGAAAVMTFGSEEFDIGGLHSTAANTERITMPTGAGGRWRFSASVLAVCSGGSTFARISLRRGGSGVHTVAKNIYNGESQTFAFSFIFNNVVATDYFDLYLESGSNTVTFGGTVGPNAGYFMAEALN